MSAPRPVMPGSTCPCTAQVAIAASTALPPALRMRIPASAASGWPAATMPCCATIVGRQLEVCCATGCATIARITTAEPNRNRLPIAASEAAIIDTKTRKHETDERVYIARGVIMFRRLIAAPIACFAAVAGAQTPAPALIVLNKDEAVLAIVDPNTRKVAGRV